MDKIQWQILPEEVRHPRRRDDKTVGMPSVPSLDGMHMVLGWIWLKVKR